MQINLKDDQEKRLKVFVEEGRFPSVDAAAQHLIEAAIAAETLEGIDDLQWAKPYLAETEEDISAGRVVSLDQHLAHIHDVLAKVRAG